MPEWWLLAIVRIAIHQRPEGRVSCHCLDWTEFSTWKVMTIWSSHSAGVRLRWGLRGPVEKTRGVSSCPPDASGFLWRSRQEFIHSLMNSSHGSPIVLCQKESARFWAIRSCACFSVSQRKWKWKSPNLKLITKRYTRKRVCEKTPSAKRQGSVWGKMGDGRGMWWEFILGHAHRPAASIIYILQTWTRIFWPHLSFEICFSSFIIFISKEIVVLLNLPLLVDCLWLFVHIWCVWVVSSFLLKINMTGTITSLEKHGPTGAP